MVRRDLQSPALVFIQWDDEQRQRAGDREETRGDEYTFVSENRLHDARKNGRERDEQRAQAGADGVMAGDELAALRYVHEEDEVARESDAVAEGLEEHDGIKPSLAGQHIRRPDVQDVRNVHADD